MADKRDQLWEINAAWWQDGFTEGADAEYTEQLLPLAAQHLAGAHRILDVGCGEGQITRLAATLPGSSLAVGIDPTWAQLSAAAARAGGARVAVGEEGGGAMVAVGEGVGGATPAAAEAGDGVAAALVRAGAAALPFATASFDAAIACLVFEHITAVDTAIGEVARVLRSGGRFIFMLNHPLLQTPGSGWIDDHILDEQYWRIGPYLLEDEGVEEVDKDVWIPFIHRPLSRYVNAMADHGLYVTHMEEPAPPPGFLARAHEYEHAATIPRLLLLRAEKLVRPGDPLDAPSPGAPADQPPRQPLGALPGTGGARGGRSR